MKAWIITGMEIDTSFPKNIALFLQVLFFTLLMMKLLISQQFTDHTTANKVATPASSYDTEAESHPAGYRMSLVPVLRDLGVSDFVKFLVRKQEYF